MIVISDLKYHVEGRSVGRWRIVKLNIVLHGENMLKGELGSCICDSGDTRGRGGRGEDGVESGIGFVRGALSSTAILTE
jgi:hypothetical protein